MSAKSQNFLLVGNGSESSLKRVGRELEEFRAALGMLFPSAAQPSAVGTTVIVFKDEPSFRPFKPLYQGKTGNVEAFFQKGQDVHYIALTAESPLQTVYHEFVHSVTKDTSQPLPPWASEGFAEVYSMFELSGKEMILGRAIGEHIGLLKSQRMLPLQQLLAVDRASAHYNEESKQGMFYAQSWASVHYMMFGANGKWRQQFVKFLGLTNNGKPIDDNFREAFQTDYTTLQEEIRKYVEQQVAWPAIRTKLPERLNFDKEMQITPLTEAQGQYYIGDLLLHMDRLDIAETQLQKAVTLDPKLAASYASLGMLKVRQDKDDEALKFLTRAVEGDSNNHLAHFYYAYLLHKLDENGAQSDRKERLAEMRTHIQKTIQLAPRFVEAYGMLAYVALVSHEGIPEAQATLKKGIEYAPGRLELRLRLAELMVANGELQQVQPLLNALRTSNAEDVVRYEAERLLDHVKDRQQYDKDMQEYLQQRKDIERRLAEAEIRDEVKPAGDEAPRITRQATENPARRGSDMIETAAPQVQGPQGLRITGKLVSVDCVAGLTLKVRADVGTVDLHTDTPENVEFVSYVRSVTDSIACGPAKPEVPVAIVYRRGAAAGGKFFGEPLRVEFVEK